MKGGGPLLSLPWIVALILPRRELLSFSYLQIANEARVHHNRLFSAREGSGEDGEGGRRLLIFGLGNVGALVARRGVAAKSNGGDAPYFDAVYGTTRSGAELKGVRTIAFDDGRTLEDVLPSCTHILATIPPVDDGANATSASCDPVLNHPNVSLGGLLPADAWVGYVSSTSVYGNHDGAWVDEASEVKCRPDSKGELYCTAENEWREAARECGWRAHVFRAAGLYGDARSAIHTIRKRGVSVDEEGAGSERAPTRGHPTSRVHEEDASRAILLAMMRGDPAAGESCLWNLADDEPAPRAEVMAFGTRLLSESNSIPAKKPDEASAMPRRRSERDRRRTTDRKRVGNRRMKERLLPDGRLLYPTYREGLQSVLDNNRDEWSSSSER